MLPCRIGLEIFDFEPFRDVIPGFSTKFSPFVFLDFERSGFSFEGGSAGLTVEQPVYGNFGVYFRAAYSDDDVIENGIRGIKDGFDFKGGLMIRY